MRNMSNKALVSVAGILGVVGAVAITGNGACLWGLLLVMWLIDSVNDNEDN